MSSQSWADMDDAEREAQELRKKLAELELKKQEQMPTLLKEVDAQAAAAAQTAPAPAASPESKTDADDEADREPQTEGLHPDDKSAKVELAGSVGNVIYKSIKSFEELGLSQDLLKGVLAMNFTSPSRIQADALPIIVSDKHPNMIAQAHHGSGKTATYSLGMLSRVDPAKQYPQALCVCPVRELANQVHDVVSKLAKYTQIKSFCAVKDAAKRKITEQVLVGTPGTLLQKMKARHFDPKKIQLFVLDEADVMVDTQGQGADMLKIRKAIPKNVQTLLFSATYADRVRVFAAKTAPDAVRITVKRETLALANIKQFKVVCANEDEKYQLMSELYALLNLGQSIIFMQTRRSAKDLSRRLRAEGFKVSLLHGGDMDHKDRDRVMDDFRKGTTTVLISTDVLSRGIDVPQVNMVVNYELPTDKQKRPNPETYIHRIGRAGRFGREGIAMTLVHDEAGRKGIDYIGDYYEKPLDQLPNDADAIAETVKKALKL